jgi:hypothetical protein
MSLEAGIDIAGLKFSGTVKAIQITETSSLIIAVPRNDTGNDRL